MDRKIKYLKVLNENCILVVYKFGVREKVCGRVEFKNGQILNGERIDKKSQTTPLDFSSQQTGFLL